jgi:asparagine synthase (glutamine-hydrolysing)
VLKHLLLGDVGDSVSIIIGLFSYNGHALADAIIENMLHKLHQYPADEVQVWRGHSLTLACHAQWITPQSVGEAMPYYDPQLKLAITADAILDNREQLCQQLQVERARRPTITDAELILLAYRQWGSDSPKMLIGDYAYVIWDEPNDLLFGARDLLGSRTLYYHHTSQQFAFCTVIEPLFSVPGITKQLNESWLAEFLAIPIIMDSIDVHGTIYNHIMMLPPAHSFTLTNGKLHLSQYDSLVPPNGQLKLRSNGEYEEAFRDVFSEAVRSKLRTFRQVGARLSGGLDSGTVVGFAAEPLREMGKTLQAYSYVPSRDFVDWTSKRTMPDETPYIQSVVRHIGSIGSIDEHYLDFPECNSLHVVDEIINLMEAPYKFIENSFWLIGMLEQAQRDGVGVLLNGSRGNYSISWGPAYDYYAHLLRRFRWMRFHSELKLYSQQARIGRSRMLPIIAKIAFPVLSHTLLRSNESGRPQLIHPDLARRTGIFERLKRHDVGLIEYGMDEFAARDYQFHQLAVSNHYGISSTKLALRYGVIERDPTSDPRVVRFCLSLPVEQYVQNGISRSLIRRATEGYLPDEVRLNHRIYGIQGADWVHRIRPYWPAIRQEVQHLCQAKDDITADLLHLDQIQASLDRIGTDPQPHQAYDPHMKIIMQSLIVSRFLRQMS